MTSAACTRFLLTGAAFCLCTAAGAVPSIRSQSPPGPALRIWIVGSPYDEDIPRTRLPPDMRRAAARLGMTLNLEAFPAQNFATTFRDAVASRSAPDVLVISNFAIIDGMPLNGGKFDGIGEDPLIRAHLIQVTGAFDSLLGPARGWVFIFAGSRNHDAAHRFALAQSSCPSGFSDTALPAELGDVVTDVVPAYLKGDAARLLPHADPERLASDGFLLEARAVGRVRPCGLVGTGKLAFVLVEASYEAERKIGHAPLALALRRQGAGWQLLVAARDPETTNGFMKEMTPARAFAERQDRSLPPPLPASLLLPADGQFPLPSNGTGFGTFTWRPSSSANVAFELVEFAYQNMPAWSSPFRAGIQTCARSRPAGCGRHGTRGAGGSGR